MLFLLSGYRLLIFALHRYAREGALGHFLWGMSIPIRAFMAMKGQYCH